MGAQDAKVATSEWLREGLPGYLQRENLPQVVAFLDHEPEAVDRWPLVAVDSAGALSIRFVEYADNGLALYECDYLMRAYCWVRGRGWDATDRLRDRFIEQVRWCLLDNPMMGGRGALLSEAGFTEEYSATEPLKGDRFHAAAFVQFAVRIEEGRLTTGVGTVNDVQVTTGPLIHPSEL